MNSLKLKLTLLLVLLIVVPVVGDEFELYYLALQWPNSFCSPHNSNCFRPVPQDFNIHVFWPGYWNGRQKTFCLRNELEKKQVATLKEDLSRLWQSLAKLSEKRDHANFEFWRAQWNKHGTCSGLDPKEYFSEALNLRKEIHDLLNLLMHSGIRPGGKTFTPKAIKSAIENEWGLMTILKCNKGSNTDLQLLEILFCIKRPTQQDATFRWISCPDKPSFGCKGEEQKIFVFPSHNGPRCEEIRIMKSDNSLGGH